MAQPERLFEKLAKYAGWAMAIIMLAGWLWNQNPFVLRSELIEIGVKLSRLQNIVLRAQRDIWEEKLERARASTDPELAELMIEEAEERLKEINDELESLRVGIQ